MNPNTAIQIQNLSKQYRLGVVGTGTLSHDLKRWWTTNVQGKEDPYLKVGEVNDRASKGTSDYVWALKDINLEIAQGDVVGIIGKNGAGKSTLLKLLSRVTKPTTGTIAYRGRIASLLEVGTGFHPEMTGRENIYMNGAIMGMTRHEISRKLDEIIAFAGVERYIDTPVKRYSSGMTVRLGFAVAAHLEPDILVVDEVLAVGDAEFQKKAIGKMQDVSREGGRTVLFVSHNMVAVKNLCPKTILFETGIIKGIGETRIIVEKYLTSTNTVCSNFFGFIEFRNRSNPLFRHSIIHSVEIRNEEGQITNCINAGEEMLVNIITSEINEITGNIGVGIYFSKGGERVAGATSFMDLTINKVNSGNKFCLKTEKLRFIPGSYDIEIVLADKGVRRIDYIENFGKLVILENDVFGNGEILNSSLGNFFIKGNWELIQ